MVRNAGATACILFKKKTHPDADVGREHLFQTATMTGVLQGRGAQAPRTRGYFIVDQQKEGSEMGSHPEELPGEGSGC